MKGVGHGSGKGADAAFAIDLDFGAVFVAGDGACGREGVEAGFLLGADVGKAGGDLIEAVSPGGGVLVEGALALFHHGDEAVVALDGVDLTVELPHLGLKLGIFGFELVEERNQACFLLLEVAHVAVDFDLAS